MFESLEWANLEAQSRYALADNKGEVPNWLLTEDGAQYILTGPNDTNLKFNTEEDAKAAADQLERSSYYVWLESQASRVDILEHHEEAMRRKAHECAVLRAEWEDLKDQTSRAKKRHEAATEDLERMAAEKPTFGPLFEPETWETTELRVLEEHGAPTDAITALSERKIRTMGDLAEHMKTGNLTDIEGIGEAKANEIVDAQAAYIAAHPEMVQA